MAIPTSAPRINAYACYLVFRHADRALQRGQIGQAAHDAASEALRDQVSRVWSEVFPGQEPAALSWVIDRLRMLEREGVLTTEAARRIRESVGPRAQQSGRIDWGALALLWRIHLLYRLVLEVSEQGRISETSRVRVKEAMHSLALSALSREVSEAAPVGRELLGRVLDRARVIVQELIGDKVVSADDGRILAASLSGTLRAAAPVRGGAKISTVTGTCLVCGDSLEARMVVFCVACDTPHHPDCWSYNGRCATFACGCVDAAPQPGGAATPRFDLERPTPPARPRSPEPPPPPESGAGFAQALVAFVVLASMVLLASVR